MLGLSKSRGSSDLSTELPSPSGLRPVTGLPASSSLSQGCAEGTGARPLGRAPYSMLFSRRNGQPAAPVQTIQDARPVLAGLEGDRHAGQRSAPSLIQQIVGGGYPR